MTDPASYRAGLEAAAKAVDNLTTLGIGSTIAAAAIRDLPVPEVPDGERAEVIAEIAAERQRQIEQEGWSVGHDDGHTEGALSIAAGCYAIHAGGRRDMRWGQVPGGGMRRPPRGWPWHADWWKPTNPRRDLIKAAALIVAEIERLDRAAPRAARGQG
jgi:hypothetical protein